MLSAAQLGITLASLGLGYVAEPAIAHLLRDSRSNGPHVPARPASTRSRSSSALTIVVFLHMVVGEMVPKNVAIAEPDRTALWLALPMRGFTVAVPAGHPRAQPPRQRRPAPAAASSRPTSSSPTRTGDELAGMLAASREEGLLDEVEHRLMTGALGFPAARGDVGDGAAGRDRRRAGRHAGRATSSRWPPGTVTPASRCSAATSTSCSATSTPRTCWRSADDDRDRPLPRVDRPPHAHGADRPDADGPAARHEAGPAPLRRRGRRRRPGRRASSPSRTSSSPSSATSATSTTEPISFRG